MGAQKTIVIEEMEKARQDAYAKIDYAMRDLFALGVPESAILMSVRMIYADIRDLEEQQNQEDAKCNLM